MSSSFPGMYLEILIRQENCCQLSVIQPVSSIPQAHWKLYYLLYQSYNGLKIVVLFSWEME